MMPADRSVTAQSFGIRLSVFYAGYFVVAGVMFPFWPLYLADRGLSNAQIGLMLALALWLRAATGPIVPAIADRTGNTRGTLIICAGASLAVMVLFFWTAGFWPLLAVSVLFLFAYSSVLPLAETIVLRAASAEEGYGRIRLWGSIAYMAAAAIGGYVLETRGALSANAVVWLMLATLALMFLSTLGIPPWRRTAGAAPRAGLRRLLSSRLFTGFMAATALIHASHGVFYGFSTLHWSAAGISKTAIGLLWAEGVMAEVVLFAFGASLVRRLGPLNLCLIAGLAGALRWGAQALTTELWALALVQLLHAATFGAFHLGAMLFITRAIPESLSNSAQGLFSGLTYGGGLGAGLLIAGWMYERWSGDAYWVEAAISALGALAILWLARHWRGGRIVEG